MRAICPLRGQAVPVAISGPHPEVSRDSVRAGRATVRRGSVTVRRGSVTVRRGSVTVRAGHTTVRGGSITVRGERFRLRAGHATVRAGRVTVRRRHATVARASAPLPVPSPCEARVRREAGRGDVSHSAHSFFLRRLEIRLEKHHTKKFQRAGLMQIEVPDGANHKELDKPYLLKLLDENKG